MDHSQETAESVDVPESHTVDSAAAAFREQMDTGEAEQADPENTEAEPAETELDETDFDDEGEAEETGEQEGEAEQSIAVPASLKAEEKETYAQLPKEAQQFVSELEARRSADVTKVTTQAAEAQRAAQTATANAEVEAKKVFAAQLEQVAGAFLPQEPKQQDYPDQTSYLIAAREYDRQIAHHSEFMEQVQSIKTEAETQEMAQFQQERDRQLMQIPEVANPETRKAYLDEAFNPEFLSELGYDQSELSQIADAEDVKRLKQIAGWRADAAKYKKAMGKQMQRVRQGKTRSNKPGTAQQTSSGQQALMQSKQRLAKTGRVDDAAAAFKAAGLI